MRYLPYEKYKTAKTEFIGDIPAHWEEWKASHGFGQIGSGTTPKSDNSAYYGGETLWVTTSELREAYVFDTAIKVTDEALADHSALKQYPIDSVVIAMYGATIGRLGMLGKLASVNQACCVYAQPEKFHPRFFYFWLWMRRPILISLSSGGGQPNLNQEELKRIRVPIPPLGEQEQIAAFLDWKTGQIDALIAKKQVLIEKLKEKRLAVITQAVTKGLDPSVPLRDSGTPWLDQIPKHWQVMKFGYRTRIEEGQVDPEFEPFSQMVLIAPNHIESNTGIVSGLATAHEQGAISGKYLVRNGDVVYSKIRPNLNKCALSDFDGLCSADMYPIRTESPLIASFLHYWMLAQPFLDYATVSSMRVAMPKLNRETLNAAPLLVPPVPEQEKITEFLDSATKNIDRFLEKADLAVSYLTEYRTALITAATTGQIDVRNVEIPAQA